MGFDEITLTTRDFLDELNQSESRMGLIIFADRDDNSRPLESLAPQSLEDGTCASYVRHGDSIVWIRVPGRENLNQGWMVWRW